MVYHGPSSGCKACRTRRVKCDQTKPACSNCIRRRQTCPGYGDIFDGAHRNQNNVVARRAEKHNAVLKTTSSSVSPGSDNTQESPISNPTSPNPSTTHTKSLKRTPLHWIIYSANAGAPASKRNGPNRQERDVSRTARIRPTPGQLGLSIPHALKQDPEEASICFFFRHYAGIVRHNSEVRNGFATHWQPLYQHSSLNSPLRAATTAFTFNITMMWCFQGCDTRPARDLLTNAISATRKAIENPSSDEMDELLMTVLIFDLYDSLTQHYVPKPVRPGTHKAGALALARLRGSANYDTILSRSLTHATRHALLSRALATRTGLPPGAVEIFDDPFTPESPVTQLDLITLGVADLQSRLWHLRREKCRPKSSQERQAFYAGIIAEAVKTDDALAKWKQALPDTGWTPHHVHRDDVAPSIRAAGFYGTYCVVWSDMQYAEMTNLYHQRRLVNLQIIRQALADEPGLLSLSQYQDILFTTTNTTVQSIVDAICANIPFHLGDTVTPRNPVYCDEIQFPTKVLQTPETGETIIIPSPTSDHKPRAAAGGGWAIFPCMVEVYRLAGPEDDAVPIMLREGQFEWIEAQIKRLQTIFLYCDPVWFKRLPPPPSSTTESSTVPT
ncbi:hypothetical protein EDD37DRAFT_268201 [Exophiala viscosa]|uniref:Zn(2)-C6 fungal-type domain-containing protein n=1 Tax=Exophiala viscosa TaxID=2486360 RepID=A0AAN6E880_9EURO|nr:hypothetical protein EDD36DRAFT_32733 [Exophiala viscosa]KAI1627618.1 hypothetical protein EDD37DRAFT_268201 [Exophiala viscosa]